MDCNAAQQQLERHLDGEIGLSDARELDAHLAQCAECCRLRNHLQALRKAIQQHAAPTAPRSLKRSIRKQLRRQSAGTGTVRTAWLGFSGGALALLAVLTWGLVNWVTMPRSGLVIDEIVSAHVRSLMVDHITDVISADTHTVKPWFKGRVNFAPAVHDLSDQGFVLQGGRLDYLQGQPVAAAVYTRRAHVINLFSWPAAAPAQGLIRHVVRGYNILQWHAGDLQHWAISDLNARELAQFASLYRGGTPRPPDTSPTAGPPQDPAQQH